MELAQGPMTYDHHPDDRGGFTIHLTQYAAGLHQPRHAHPFSSLTVVLTGAVQEFFMGGGESATALSVVFKPAMVEHADFYPAQTRTLQVRLTDRLLKDSQEGASQEERLRRPCWHHQAGSAAKALLSLLPSPDCPGNSPETENAIFEALAAVIATQKKVTGAPPLWLSRAKREIDETPACEMLRVSVIAEHAQVHPVHLTRMFRSYFQCSIREYLVARRVRTAAALLGTSSGRITDVAHHSGFADQAHLCRAFKSCTGINPGGYAKRLRFSNEMLETFNHREPSAS